MVHSKNNCTVFHLLSGQCSMEISVLLLLTLPLTTGSPLRVAHRSDADPHPADSGQASGATRLKDTLEEQAHALRVIAFHSEDKRVAMEALKLSEGMSWRPRPRRTTHGGCQLGTCQLHNLANALFNFSKTSGKDKSEKASHPEGYGR